MPLLRVDMPAGRPPAFLAALGEAVVIHGALALASAAHATAAAR